ncbi:hypothetical protein DY000_02006283 [Brassica cretica]|uniref:Reverse transcriptase zinc-binding domain-containing protein n=1 Tax=Brassica cretica TaxID=69181 RepID=A0ABQ7BZF0_BRACR|nr:hypothetical protein DY000_02006283 [Brassica cretica]
MGLLNPTLSAASKLFMGYQGQWKWTAFFWFDEWMKQGKLIDNTGEVGTCLLGVARTARYSGSIQMVCISPVSHQTELGIKLERGRTQCFGVKVFGSAKEGCVLCGERDETKDLCSSTVPTPSQYGVR